MNILVTGAAGFIGSHVSEALLRRGDQVVGVDNFNMFYDPQLKRRNSQSLTKYPGFSLEELDICDERGLRALFDSRTFDAIIHLAAWAGVRPSIVNPQIYMDVNVRGTLNLLELARQKDISRVVFASSSSRSFLGYKNPLSRREGIVLLQVRLTNAEDQPLLCEKGWSSVRRCENRKRSLNEKRKIHTYSKCKNNA